MIDNISSLLGDNLKDNLSSSSTMRIAAASFSIYAFEAMRKELKDIKKFNFIFTSPKAASELIEESLLKESKEFIIQRLEEALLGSEHNLKLRNKLTQKRIAQECASWIKEKGNFKANSSEDSMQQFIHINNADTSNSYLPINGFTLSDLGYERGKYLSNLVAEQTDHSETSLFLNTFRNIWNDDSKVKDVKQAVCSYLEKVYQENSPEKIYFLILYNIFKDFLNELSDDRLAKDQVGYKNSDIWKKLYNFQRDGASGAINKLETFNGCILADSVGLGKTFTALAVIKYYELRNQRVLVLCPKKLSQNWMSYNSNLKTNIFSKDRFNYDVLCHTDLSRTKGESFGIPLNRVNWGNYDLVVIDESHNFRNNTVFKDRESRYQKLMSKVIKDGIKTKVLMLSATPVNNRFSDLKNQLALTYAGQSSELSEKLKGTKSIESIFYRAQKAFNQWSKLPADKRTASAILKKLDFDFFELLDSVTIARSRKHIQNFYDTKEIGSFPKRLKPISVRCSLSEQDGVFELKDIIGLLNQLKLSVYAPLHFVLSSRLSEYEKQYDTLTDGRGKLKHLDREKSLQALITTNLLKRLESSVEAFCITLKSLLQKIDNTLQFIEGDTQQKQYNENLKFLEGQAIEDEELAQHEEVYIGAKVKVRLDDLDLLSWRRDLSLDRDVINKLLASMQIITPSDDLKLEHLLATIRKKIATNLNEGNNKVIIFTAFADTADYLYKNLAPKLLTSLGIHSAKITGSSSPKTTLDKSYDFLSVLTLFSPISNNKKLTMPLEQGEIDILIATDCISEGQNLQDCDFLINYDIHWNPVRVIQRFGRIDRIGSSNDSIQMVNYWPDLSLDEYINLKDRVEDRMVISDLAATGDDNIFTLKSNDITIRKEQLKRLQDEVVDLEDTKQGVSITDLGLNDFRMELINYIRDYKGMGSMPLGLHTVVPAEREKDILPGTIFILKNCNKSTKSSNLNRLHPYYFCYISDDLEVIGDHHEVSKMLDLMRQCCKGRKEPLEEVVNLFNQETKDGWNMVKQTKQLNRAIESLVGAKRESDIDSLFDGGKTSALVTDIQGLEDFELIAFIVIQDTGV